MMKASLVPSAPPDQAQRISALDPQRSILVQAPAGSGKTDLLTRRFLRLLTEVDDPIQIVAITFTRAAAAEMRHRILSELEKAAGRATSDQVHDEFSMESLADRALARSHSFGWQLLDLTSQLRISTIDSFCRELAIQQPIYSGVGNNLQINERPTDLYRRAARLTLNKLGDSHQPELSDSIRDLLLWRDNGWKELEELLVKMLAQRDRWMHKFVLSQEPDWNEIREWLERPFGNAVRSSIATLTQLLNQVPGACDEALELAQFACEHGRGELHRELAELAEFPYGPYDDSIDLENARSAYLCLANLLLTKDGEFRQQIDIRLGFPKENLDEKLRLQDLIAQLAAVPGLEKQLAGIAKLPPARYSDEDWQIVRASFTLLRHAAGELKAVFAEAGAVDFVEVAQIARQVLLDEDRYPTDTALAAADNIRHLLVDEFQDTSRRQHEFISALILAWPERTGRTLFVVGDPMQSIYSFRDAEAELFGRVKDVGFEFSDEESFPVDPLRLTANFRTDPQLVFSTNDAFEKVFGEPDGSGIEFAKAEPARSSSAGNKKRFELHLQFIPQVKTGSANDPESIRAREEIKVQRETARTSQVAELIALIRSHLDRVDAARIAGKKYRIAVLGRARTALAPIAAALREEQIPFRAVELENLKDQPEILDATALAHALFNPQDRVAWLGVLRAPWCGLSLAELHTIAGTDDALRPTAPIPELLRDRLDLLPTASRKAAERVLNAFAFMPKLRNSLPTASTGTLVQRIWHLIGGDQCVNASGRANLELFWKLLDDLPSGEQDLTGPALDAALEDFCALPDPTTSSECGVQLMTIHKSKGLEFEIVIVPDLHARNGSSKSDLLSWFERGIAEPNESGDLTEFLVAPLQFKGEERGKAKTWVDNIRRQRELQETRRILYVAATRAREELHIFAQPTYKSENGVLTLLEPRNSLLATAWPALADEILDSFDEWMHAHQGSGADVGLTVQQLAASGESNLIVMPSPAQPTIIRRLPEDFHHSDSINTMTASAESVIGLGDNNLYQRHEGGLFSRALGNAVHKLLDDLARLCTNLDWHEARNALENFRPRISASVRSVGLSASQAHEITSKAYECALNASQDPYGQWILSQHSEAASESSWAGIVSGDLRLVRVDRLFRAGLEPLLPGDGALWIIDYKTAHTDNLDPTLVLPGFRATFAPQLKIYADVLRNLHGTDLPLRAGLYYPRMSLFDWWEI
ncbi:UvrD-helicase domain-containing protein [Telmatobacter sp. DSM 110680]|uniref:DNA 3'-5' helicase n=1 Tax=Telmatobacter sp. DSM 110680 TaxID=3036704 RepID=A0AAU7DFS7_9BACT